MPTSLEGFSPSRAIEFCAEETLPRALDAIQREAEAAGESVERIEIGHSRAGRAMWGLRLGRGARRVSLTAGAHADEPIGPMTALALARWLVGSEPGRGWLATHRFHICPQVNPDGAEANRAWFADPIDPLVYFERALREPPGDDIEFGYPGPDESAPGEGESKFAQPARPENLAVAEFLRAAGGPFVYHASLHSTGFAEGAWFLIGRQWAERSAPLRDRLTAATSRAGLPLHDIDRGGEKGFTRIAPGFCTTPTSGAMRDYFRALGDPVTAALFRPSSMEWIAALGGDPLVMVSEVPLLLIGVAYERSDPPRDDTPWRRFRAALAEPRRALIAGDPAPMRDLMREYRIEATPIRTQVELQARMILEALAFLMERESS